MQRILFACAAVVTSSVEAGLWEFNGSGDGENFKITYSPAHVEDKQPPGYIPKVGPKVRKHLTTSPSAHLVYIKSNRMWGWADVNTN